ncbi:MAG: hypothetical protein ABI729_02545 [Chitinophagales bacterium]
MKKIKFLTCIVAVLLCTLISMNKIYADGINGKNDKSCDDLSDHKVRFIRKEH